MNTKRLFVSALVSSVALLAGCAGEMEQNEPDPEPIVIQKENVGESKEALTGPCTTTSSCDKNYCCTTVDCRFVTTITCKAATKVASMTYAQ